VSKGLRQVASKKGTPVNDIQLHHGDCLEIMPTLEAGSFDAIIADLPYGTTACKWDTVIPFAPLWREYKRLIKPRGAIVLFGSQPFTSLLVTSNLEWFRYDWYWQKDKGSNFLFGNKQPMKVIETISVFYEEQPTYNPQKTINPNGPSKRHLSFNTSNGNSDRAKDIMPNMPAMPIAGKSYEADKLLPKQLIYFAREQRDKQHPTQKPVALLEYLVRTYTNPGDVVLDNTMGSGTTMVACIQTGRRGVGIEKEAKYFEIARDRIEATIQWIKDGKPDKKPKKAKVIESDFVQPGMLDLEI